MNLTFSEFGDLLCPYCGHIHIRHKKVELFERAEDSASGIHTTISDFDTKVDKDMSDNPSRRRHGLLIHFSCEACPKESVLAIYQHKGNTLLEFKEQPE